MDVCRHTNSQSFKKVTIHVVKSGNTNFSANIINHTAVRADHFYTLQPAYVLEDCHPLYFVLSLAIMPAALNALSIAADDAGIT